MPSLFGYSCRPATSRATACRIPTGIIHAPSCNSCTYMRLFPKRAITSGAKTVPQPMNPPQRPPPLVKQPTPVANPATGSKLKWLGPQTDAPSQANSTDTSRERQLQAALSNHPRQRLPTIAPPCPQDESWQRSMLPAHCAHLH